jgi:hypothetical protein
VATEKSLGENKDNPFGGDLRDGGFEGEDDTPNENDDGFNGNGPVGDALCLIIFFSLLYGGYKKHRDARPCVSTKILL